MPIVAGLIFFALARFTKYIAPIRHFSAGEQTYSRAYVGFIAFGIYLASRPLQILLGPHPMPLIVNDIREFFMLGIFGPSIFLAIYGLAYGGENIKKWMNVLFHLLGLACAIVFITVNISAIGGTEEIFRIGNYPAFDGLWFKNLTPERTRLMSVLFLCRVISPVLLLAIGATIGLFRAFSYPQERKKFTAICRKSLYSRQ